MARAVKAASDLAPLSEKRGIFMPIETKKQPHYPAELLKTHDSTLQSQHQPRKAHFGFFHRIYIRYHRHCKIANGRFGELAHGFLTKTKSARVSPRRITLLASEIIFGIFLELFRNRFVILPDKQKSTSVFIKPTCFFSRSSGI